MARPVNSQARTNVIESYDEYNHPGRRKEDRQGRHVHIQRQVNITIEPGGITKGGKLVICLESTSRSELHQTTGERLRAPEETDSS